MSPALGVVETSAAPGDPGGGTFPAAGNGAAISQTQPYFQPPREEEAGKERGRGLVASQASGEPGWEACVEHRPQDT